VTRIDLVSEEARCAGRLPRAFSDNIALEVGSMDVIGGEAGFDTMIGAAGCQGVGAVFAVSKKLFVATVACWGR
jgi:hypothetical protein